MLQCIAACCSVLQCVAACCSVLYLLHGDWAKGKHLAQLSMPRGHRGGGEFSRPWCLGLLDLQRIINKKVILGQICEFKSANLLTKHITSREIVSNYTSHALLRLAHVWGPPCSVCRCVVCGVTCVSCGGWLRHKYTVQPLQHSATHYNTLQHTATRAATTSQRFETASTREGFLWYSSLWRQVEQVSCFICEAPTTSGPFHVWGSYKKWAISSLSRASKTSIFISPCTTCTHDTNRLKISKHKATVSIPMPLFLVLQCVAVCCSVLQCVAECCSVMQCDAVLCSVVQCVAVRCSVLQCIAACCSVLQRDAVWCSLAVSCNEIEFGHEDWMTLHMHSAVYQLQCNEYNLQWLSLQPYHLMNHTIT